MLQTDVLVLTAGFGNGHNTAAKAIKEQISKSNPELNVKIIDGFSIIAPSFKEYLFKGYRKLTFFLPSAYNLFYNIRKDNKNNLIDSFLCDLYLSRFSKFLINENPKIVISTFPICSGLVSRFKKKFDMNIPLITCITDVVDSWEWIHEGTNMYFVPAERVREDLILKGVSSEIIKVTGVPVSQEFLKNNRESSNKKQILIMGNALKSLNLNKQLLSELDGIEKIKTIIVTGDDQRLFKKLQGDYKNIEVIGYTKEIAKLMEESHILVTKAGGATLFEAINMCLPIIVQDTIVGQEKHNVEFVKENKIGILMDDMKDLVAEIQSVLNKSDELEMMGKNMQNIRNSMQTENIAQYVLEFI